MTTPPQHPMRMVRGGMGLSGFRGYLETELPQTIQIDYPGRALPGRDLLLDFQLGIDLPLLPDEQQSGGEGGRSQKTDNESADRTSWLGA
jgi:hypothetical protein